MSVPAGLNEAKRGLRREIASLVRSLPAAVRRAEEARVADALGQFLGARGFSTVLGYLSLPDEICVDRILAAAVAGGARVLLPRTGGDAGPAWVRWSPAGRLSRDACGVLAPEGPGEGPGGLAGSLVLVPGRAFDRKGNRLGRGGGTYDRVLAGLPEGVVPIGVAFSAQLVDAVPAGPADRPVRGLLTGEGWIIPWRETDGRAGTTRKEG